MLCKEFSCSSEELKINKPNFQNAIDRQGEVGEIATPFSIFTSFKCQYACSQLFPRKDLSNDNETQNTQTLPSYDEAIRTFGHSTDACHDMDPINMNSSVASPTI